MTESLGFSVWSTKGEVGLRPTSSFRVSTLVPVVPLTETVTHRSVKIQKFLDKNWPRR